MIFWSGGFIRQLLRPTFDGAMETLLIKNKKMFRFFIITGITVLSAGRLFTQPVPCGPDAEMTSFCAEACVVCDIDGFTGYNNISEDGEAPDDFCTTTVHHAQWIAFIAGSENLTITVTPSSCNSGWGLEVAIYESLDCENFNLVTNCDGDINLGEVGTFTNTVPLVIGQYYYFVMDGNHDDSCNYTINVTEGSTMVPPLPDPEPIEGAETVCLSETAAYSIPPISGANFYEWRLNGQLISEGDSTEIAWNTPGTYELCVTAFNVCDTVVPACMLVQVLEPETTDLTFDICEGNCIEVADSLICDPGNYAFTLSTVEGCDSIVNAEISLLPASITNLHASICSTDSLLVGNTWYYPPGQFTETLSGVNGCDSIINLTLNQIICEISGVTSAQPVECFGEASGVLTFSISNGTPPFTYLWQQFGGDLSGSGILAGINTEANINDLPEGTYLITVNDQFGNDVILTTYISSPPPLSLEFFQTLYNGFNIDCFGDATGSVSVMVQGGTPEYSYVWSNGQTQPTISGLSSGNYAVMITDAAGCEIGAQVSLDEPPPLEITVVLTDPNCDGPDSGSAEILSVSGGVAPYAFAINEQAFGTTSLFSGLSSGTNTVSAIDANGCLADTTAILDEVQIPEVDLGEDFSVDLGNTTYIDAYVSLNSTSFAWSPETGLSCIDCLDPEVLPLDTITYWLSVTSEDGCTREDSVTIRVRKNRNVYVPNAFSPNNDGVNDAFTVFAGVNVAEIKNFKVFSRWGELVFERSQFLPNDLSLGWDGTFRGQKVQRGVFVWRAEIAYIDGAVFSLSGDVVLVE